MSEGTNKALKKADKLMAIIRSATAASIPLQVAHTFILVAMNEGQGVTDLADKAGATKATMSRHLLDLSDRLRNGEDGHGLLQRSQDPSNLRSIAYTLTPKGKLLRRQIEDILE